MKRLSKWDDVCVGDTVKFLDESGEGDSSSRQGELYRVERIDNWGSVTIRAKPLKSYLPTIECFLSRFGRGPATSIDDWL